MNTTATWYRGGNAAAGDYIGNIGYDGAALVGRFAFTTGAAGASTLSFRTDDLSPAGSNSWGGGDHDSFRFRITETETSLVGHTGGDGSAVGVYWPDTSTHWLTSGGSVNVTLQPNTTYYLWLYPDSTSYRRWRIGGVSVTLGGSYGGAAGPAAGDGHFGESLGITLSGGSAGAVYTVSVACAGRTETLQTKGSATVLSWTPAVAVYAPLLPNTASTQATITVQTWYGTYLAGSRSAGITLRFRAADVGPTLSAGWYSHAPYNTGAAAAIARYIDGVSRAEFSFHPQSVSTSYGASIAGYSVSCRGNSAAESPWRTPVLNGETAVTVTVRDSRGFTASECLTLTPLSYAAPTLADVDVFRCDANGTAAEDGQYCSVSATAVFSALEGDNSVSLLRSLRVLSGNFGAAAAQADGQSVIVPGLDPDLNYELKLEVVDALGSSGTILRQIPGRRWAMKFHPAGTGVGFGMAPQGTQRLEIPESWEIRRGAALYVPLTESGSSGIWRWRKWADGSFELLGSTSVSADVDRSWGALYYATALSGVSYPFTITAIDYAAASVANIYCWAMGDLGASLSDTGSVYVLSAAARTGMTLPLRLLIRGRWN
jgi:hypothetical protein